MEDLLNPEPKVFDSREALSKESLAIRRVVNYMGIYTVRVKSKY